MLGMENGMATIKLTITMDDDQFANVKRLVAAGQASSVSGFVRKAVETALHDEAGWEQMLNEALHASGGPLTNAERDWADEVLGHKKAGAKKQGRS
jgi:Arc/MetJ-type ribon-helix-helix transcriptional regulator